MILEIVCGAAAGAFVAASYLFLLRRSVDAVARSGSLTWGYFAGYLFRLGLFAAGAAVLLAQKANAGFAAYFLAFLAVRGLAVRHVRAGVREASREVRDES